jgi:hypothetical protein
MDDAEKNAIYIPASALSTGQSCGALHKSWQRHTTTRTKWSIVHEIYFATSTIFSSTFIMALYKMILEYNPSHRFLQVIDIPT